MGDHRIHGAVVFPGAGYVAMALQAATEVAAGSAVELEGVEFRKALFVPEEAAPRVQAVYEPDSRALEIHAQNGGGEEWTLHAACRLGAASGEAEPPRADLDGLRARCTREMSHREFYDEVGQRGFTFGPRFMGVEKLYRGEGEALGLVRLPDAHAVEVNGDRVHPALFDAGLQVLIAAVTSREQPQNGRLPAFLPTRAARVVSHRPLGTTFWSHAVVDELTPEAFQGTVSIHDEQGELLLRVEGLRAKTLEEVGSAQAAADVLYRLVWEERPALAGTAAATGAWCSPAQLAQEVGAAAPRLSVEHDFAGYYEELEPTLERIAHAFFARALGALGFDLRPGRTVGTAALPDGTVLAPPRQRQVEAIASALAEAGVLAREGAAFRVVQAPAADDPAALAAALRARRPGWAGVLDVLSRCGQALPDVIAGRRAATEVLFSGDGLEEMAAFYRASPACALFNALTADAVSAAVAGLPAGRRLRVLEVGGGTAGTTRWVLPRLDRARTEYVFTDVSPLFVSLARQQLGQEAVARWATLDVERDPAEQGLEPGSFDVVLAANVVHATADVQRTLERLRDLLAPGGLLVLQEITRRPRWLDVVFGLTEGWWAFADRTLRPAHALLEPAAWRRALAQAGLEEPSVLSETEGDPPGQSVLLARAPLGPALAAAAPWLVLADRQGVGERLADALRRRGHACAVAFADEAPGRAGGHGVAPGDGAAARQLLRDVEREVGAPVGLVHLWSLDMAPAEGLDGDALLREQRLGYASLLEFVHALQEGAAPALRRCALVTAGAQALAEGQDRTEMAQAPLWGFGRILLHEHPELRPLLVDLGPAPPAEEVEALAAEITAEEREDEVALRGTRRYARRLTRLDGAQPEVAEAPAEPARGRSFRADIARAGSLDSVLLREFPRRRPGADEIEIEVKAASLNFRDVMFAMGMLPPAAFDNMLSAGALGVDCAGVVTAVG
ncbi:MAG TPA: polyketide synthase dehydratase domain-containing protein, partial [Vicinamibacteria bacterium]|nr:polyketide synthase dehydratase domain-containing protein [Vicinamibacteria bacterium]